VHSPVALEIMYRASTMMSESVTFFFGSHLEGETKVVAPGSAMPIIMLSKHIMNAFCLNYAYICYYGDLVAREVLLWRYTTHS
jgi:hypothetical protein